ncbi:unnamed protein product [Zymoseptoria tritici ST99CH_1E4]|uniref:Uncharacterized protein n=1 Tax=Zymoseptoria tritici ST99CH_1E4 TaxID=1276532 RepID=A0A2H1FWI0_ZYMTR|nr:unnamed protein product [Zymoseptoria tritici ST99CH_1E4]
MGWCSCYRRKTTEQSPASTATPTRSPTSSISDIMQMAKLSLLLSVVMTAFAERHVHCTPSDRSDPDPKAKNGICYVLDTHERLTYLCNQKCTGTAAHPAKCEPIYNTAYATCH